VFELYCFVCGKEFVPKKSVVINYRKDGTKIITTYFRPIRYYFCQYVTCSACYNRYRDNGTFTRKNALFKKPYVYKLPRIREDYCFVCGKGYAYFKYGYWRRFFDQYTVCVTCKNYYVYNNNFNPNTKPKPPKVRIRYKSIRMNGEERERHELLKVLPPTQLLQYIGYKPGLEN